MSLLKRWCDPVFKLENMKKINYGEKFCHASLPWAGNGARLDSQGRELTPINSTYPHVIIIVGAADRPLWSRTDIIISQDSQDCRANFDLLQEQDKPRPLRFYLHFVFYSKNVKILYICWRRSVGKSIGSFLRRPTTLTREGFRVEIYITRAEISCWFQICTLFLQNDLVKKVIFLPSYNLFKQELITNFI